MSFPTTAEDDPLVGLSRACYSVCQTRLGHAMARAVVAGLRRAGLCRDFFLPFDALQLDHPAVAGLMRLWACIHWSAGDGMMPPEQLLALYRLAATWPGEGDTVELGAWVGLTTCYLATACSVRGRGKVYAVDTFAGTREGDTQYPSVERYQGSTLAAFDERIARADVASHVRKIIGLTAEAAQCYTGGPIRLLLIDADHSYEGVRDDFQLWSRWVAPGGLIVFHDYQMADVARFVDREVRGHEDFLAAPGHVVPNVFAVTKRSDRAVKRSKPRSATAPAAAVCP